MTSTKFLRGLIFVGENKYIFGGRYISSRLIYADFSTTTKTQQNLSREN